MKIDDPKTILYKHSHKIHEPSIFELNTKLSFQQSNETEYQEISNL